MYRCAAITLHHPGAGGPQPSASSLTLNSLSVEKKHKRSARTKYSDHDLVPRTLDVARCDYPFSPPVSGSGQPQPPQGDSTAAMATIGFSNVARNPHNRVWRGGGGHSKPTRMNPFKIIKVRKQAASVSVSLQTDDLDCYKSAESTGTKDEKETLKDDEASECQKTKNDDDEDEKRKDADSLCGDEVEKMINDNDDESGYGTVEKVVDCKNEKAQLEELEAMIDALDPDIFHYKAVQRNHHGFYDMKDIDVCVRTVVSSCRHIRDCAYDNIKLENRKSIYESIPPVFDEIAESGNG